MKRPAVILACLASCGLPALATGVPELDMDKLNPSAVCGECHQTIYAMWRRSMHAAAATDPIFEASYDRAYRETAGKAEQLCLRCHAPAALHSGEAGMQDGSFREGISCDYCHSVIAVDLRQHDSPMRIALDGRKRGPLRQAESPAHGVQRSDLHLSAEFCGACHEYVNEAGLAVLSTYSEWRVSPQASQGKTCQHCHMPMTPGETVPSSLAPSRGMINLHDLSGGHSADQVRKAATLRIVRFERTAAGDAQIEVEVASVGSGHSLPTGMPTRKILLEVAVFHEGREIRRFEHPYQKQILDARGNLILEDHATSLRSHRLLEDNRLRAGERRIERFVATGMPRGSLRVAATLRYVYEPRLLLPKAMSIEMASDEAPTR